MNTSTLPKSLVAPLIDGHVHLVERDRIEHVARCENLSSGHVPLSLDEYSQAMDHAGIERAVLTTSQRWYGFDNTLSALAAASDPGRFAAMGCLDVLADGAMATFERWADMPGVRGLRLYGAQHVNAEEWLQHPTVRAVLKEMAARRLVVSFQRTRISTIPALRVTIEGFPELAVVVYSAADADVDAPRCPDMAVMGGLAEHPGVFVSCSAETAAKGGCGRGPRLLEILAEAFGPSRLIWGSYSMFHPTFAANRANVPTGDISSLLHAARADFGFLDPSGLAAVFGGTACAVFWDDADSASSPDEIRSRAT